MTSAIRVGLIAGALLCLATFGAVNCRSRSNHERMPLYEALVLGKDNVVNRSFTVESDCGCLIGIELPTALPPGLLNPRPPDKFFVAFQLSTEENGIILQGDNRSDMRRPRIVNREKTVRILESFAAQRGRHYKLTVKITDLERDMLGKPAAVMVFPDGKG